MTTNQTIDGVLVSRALLERIISHCNFWHDHPYLEAIQGIDKELRALLDAPACDPDCLHCCGGGRDPFGAVCGCSAPKPAAQPQGDPVGYVIPGDMPAQSGYTKTVNPVPEGKYTFPLYAEQPAPVAVYEEFEFCKWTHEVIAESRIGGVTIKIQRMQHLTPSEEKSAHDAWMARAALNTKSR